VETHGDQSESAELGAILIPRKQAVSSKCHEKANSSAVKNGSAQEFVRTRGNVEFLTTSGSWVLFAQPLELEAELPPVGRAHVDSCRLAQAGLRQLRGSVFQFRCH
jgi:hypothetical protein